MNFSVLRNAKPEDIILKPYPHIVIKDAVEEGLYKRLESQYPSTREILEKDVGPNDVLLNNTRYQVSANKELESYWWNMFVAYHCSKPFFNEVADLFGEYINIKDSHGYYKNFKDMACGKRNGGGMYKESDSSSFDVGLDCQVGINTPVVETSRVIGMHTDQPNKAFVGMLYMRDEQDDSIGGHLQVYKHKEGHEKNMDINNMEIHSTVEYARNTAIFFVNSPLAIHAVTLRQPTQHRRRLVNFIGEISK